jgi:hypothetical protein
MTGGKDCHCEWFYEAIYEMINKSLMIEGKIASAKERLRNDRTQ